MKLFSSIALATVIGASLIVVTPAEAYDSDAHAKAAITISTACMWWQLGQIPKSNIISTAKDMYREKYGNSGSIDWNKAI